MRVFGTGINMQVAKHLATQPVFGEHATDSFLQHVGWAAFHQFLGRLQALTAWVTGVKEIIFYPHFLARKPHLVCVDDNDIVPAVYVWGVAGFVLAPENRSNAGGQASHNL